MKTTGPVCPRHGSTGNIECHHVPFTLNFVSSGMTLVAEPIDLSFERFRATLALAEGCHMGNPGLVEQTPGLARNHLVLAVLLQLAGATGKARAQLADLGELGTVRPTRIGDRDAPRPPNSAWSLRCRCARRSSPPRTTVGSKCLTDNPATWSVIRLLAEARNHRFGDRTVSRSRRPPPWRYELRSRPSGAAKGSRKAPSRVLSACP